MFAKQDPCDCVISERCIGGSIEQTNSPGRNFKMLTSADLSRPFHTDFTNALESATRFATLDRIASILPPRHKPKIGPLIVQAVTINVIDPLFDWRLQYKAMQRCSASQPTDTNGSPAIAVLSLLPELPPMVEHSIGICIVDERNSPLAEWNGDRHHAPLWALSMKSLIRARVARLHSRPFRISCTKVGSLSAAQPNAVGVMSLAFRKASTSASSGSVVSVSDCMSGSIIGVCLPCKRQNRIGPSLFDQGRLFPMANPDDARKYLASVIPDGEMKRASEALGHSHAYLQQYIKYGKPRWLSEPDRVALLQLYPQINEDMLRAPAKLPKKAGPDRSDKPRINFPEGDQVTDDPRTFKLLEIWGRISSSPNRDLGLRMLEQLTDTAASVAA
jgi:hypothetical protein